MNMSNHGTATHLGRQVRLEATDQSKFLVPLGQYDKVSYWANVLIGHAGHLVHVVPHIVDVVRRTAKSVWVRDELFRDGQLVRRAIKVDENGEYFLTNHSYFYASKVAIPVTD
jgi:hypothetical protein